METLTKELFVLKNGENYILYAPLQKSILEVNAGVLPLLESVARGELPENEKIIDHLRSARIIVDPTKDRFSLEQKVGEIFMPTSVTLFPTSNCNLMCIYCYACAGERGDIMPIWMGKSAVDLIAKNALKLNEKEFHVGFHGDGEPFMNFPFMQEIVAYSKHVAKNLDKKVTFSCGTNGVLNEEQLKWAVENLTGLTLSVDGTKDIHELQRPLRGKGSSFDYLMNTIKYFEENKFKYGTRTTITQHNVNRMEEMIDFMSGVISKKHFHFEPVFECGRCRTTDTKELDPQEFLIKFLEAKKYAEERGIDMYYSGGKPDKITNEFCGALGRNFYVTERGDVTTCLEVSKKEDPRSKIFFYGKCDEETKQFEFEQDKINYLRTRQVEKLDNCKDCFCKYSCAGDCPAKVALSGDIFDTSQNRRCSINQGVNEYQIKKKLEDQKSKKDMKGGN